MENSRIADNEKEVGIWMGILKAAMSIPGAKVNRRSFIEKEFSKYFSEDEVNNLIEGKAEFQSIDKRILDRIADGSIRFHAATCTGTSALAGIPGGIAMIGTIPADLAQYYYHVIVSAQKLAYIYGWPPLDDDEPSDEFLLLLTLFIGVMSGAQSANIAIKNIANKIATEVVKRLPRQALTKYGFYQAAKQVAKWLGISLTKAGFARGIAKIVPLLGAAISGGVTIVAFVPMASKLKRHLRELPLASGRESE